MTSTTHTEIALQTTEWDNMARHWENDGERVYPSFSITRACQNAVTRFCTWVKKNILQCTGLPLSDLTA